MKDKILGYLIMSVEHEATLEIAAGGFIGENALLQAVREAKDLIEDCSEGWEEGYILEIISFPQLKTVRRYEHKCEREITTNTGEKIINPSHKACENCCNLWFCPDPTAQTIKKRQEGR